MQHIWEFKAKWCQASGRTRQSSHDSHRKPFGWKIGKSLFWIHNNLQYNVSCLFARNGIQPWTWNYPATIAQLCSWYLKLTRLGGQLNPTIFGVPVHCPNGLPSIAFAPQVYNVILFSHNFLLDFSMYIMIINSELIIYRLHPSTNELKSKSLLTSSKNVITSQEKVEWPEMHNVYKVKTIISYSECFCTIYRELDLEILQEGGFSQLCFGFMWYSHAKDNIAHS